MIMRIGILLTTSKISRHQHNLQRFPLTQCLKADFTQQNNWHKYKKYITVKDEEKPEHICIVIYHLCIPTWSTVSYFISKKNQNVLNFRAPDQSRGNRAASTVSRTVWQLKFVR